MQQFAWLEKQKRDSIKFKADDDAWSAEEIEGV